MMIRYVVIFIPTLSCFIRLGTDGFVLDKRSHQYNYSSERRILQGDFAYRTSFHRLGTEITDISPTRLDDEDDDSTGESRIFGSRVTWISSKNLGGVTSLDGRDIRVEFPPDGSFVACTGETGSGKSLLLAKTVELLCGGKTSKILGPDLGRNGVVAEIEFILKQPHVALVQDILNSNQVKVERLGSRLHCKRSIILEGPKQSKSGKYRLKSLCELNGRPVTLQLLSSIVTPLVAVVDGTKAASALARPEARTSILDAAIPVEVLADVAEKKEVFRNCRKEREILQATLDNRAVPKGFSLDNEEDAKLLSHWINELNAFKSRVLQLCRSLGGLGSDKRGVVSLCNQLANLDWMDSNSSDSTSNVSVLYSMLIKLRDKLKALDNNLVAAHNALNALTLLSSKESVLTALERSRSFVDEATRGDLEDDTIFNAAERCHDLLNTVEEATKRCAQNLEDDSHGLIQRLEAERSLCPVSVEVIDGILLDWGTLARKHGVPPAALPSCHQALITEQSGCNEALELLPKLVAREQEALIIFVDSCRRLSTMRKHVAKELCSSVNERLPGLGMKPTFDICINSNRLNIPEKLMSFGADDVAFLISQNSPSTSSQSTSQGDLHIVASSGEKARILLAIECSIPGSVATACIKSSAEATDEIMKRPVPVLVIYDEIDAHVGGFAATAVATMLLEQARTNQVLAITHNPAVAALADHHIVVQKLISLDEIHKGSPVSVKSLAPHDRTHELARMAAGNLALKEAEAFASALIRDGSNMRKMTESGRHG
ncbi:hypothetical protein ACA910_000237 [Epithemia clementina (nom. ined.)]